MKTAVNQLCKIVLILGFVGIIAPANSQTIEVTKKDSLLKDNNSNMKADPGDSLRYITKIIVSGAPATTVMLDTMNFDSNLTINPNYHIGPLARRDNYDCIGNVGLNVLVSDGLLQNDIDLDMKAAGGLKATMAGATSPDTPLGTEFTTPGGGKVTVNADGLGAFTYDPSIAYSGLDSFVYLLTDGDPVTPDRHCKVIIDVSDLIWFINIGGSGTDKGTLANPFLTLGSFNTANVGGAGKPSAGDKIFLYTGAYPGGTTLLNNQILIGQGATATLASIFGIIVPTGSNALPATNGTDPVITNTSGDGIFLASGNTIRGLNIGACSDFGIDDPGSTVGNLTISEVDITNTTGGGFRTDNGGTHTVAIGNLTSTEGVNGIDLGGSVSGTFSVSGTTAITNSTSTAVNLSTISASVNFNILNITNTTSNSTGIFANSGTINTSSGTISTGSGRAVDINNATLGMTLTSVSSNGGAAPGIDLNTTTGSFSVVGDESNTQGGNDTGGIIQNKTGDGIVLNNATNVHLQNMTIGNTATTAAGGPTDAHNIDRDGIDASSVSGLTLKNITIADTGDHGLNSSSCSNLNADNSLILNTGGLMGDNPGGGGGQEEHGFNLDQLSGDNFIKDCLFDAFNETGVELVNTSGQCDLTVDNTTFQDNLTTIGNAGEEAILIEAQGTAVIVVLVTGSNPATSATSMTNSVFDDIARQAIQAISLGSNSDIDLTVENSKFLETQAGDAVIIMNPDNSGDGNVTVKNNYFTDNTFGPFALLAKNDSNGELDVTIQKNKVDNLQLLSVNHDDTGSAGANMANGTTRALIGGDVASLGNIVTVGTANIGIDIISTEMGPVGNAPDISLSILNNNISVLADFMCFCAPAIRIEAQQNTRMNLDIDSNIANGSNISALELKELDSGAIKIKGFVGGDNTAATGYIDGKNTFDSEPSFLIGTSFEDGDPILPTQTTLPSL